MFRYKNPAQDRDDFKFYIGERVKIILNDDYYTRTSFQNSFELTFLNQTDTKKPDFITKVSKYEVLLVITKENIGKWLLSVNANPTIALV